MRLFPKLTELSNTPQFWLDIQVQSEIAELSADKEFTALKLKEKIFSFAV